MENIYVSPRGNDKNNGTESSPFLTLEKALDAVKIRNRDTIDDFTVNLDDGYYFLKKTFELTEKDNLRDGKRLTFKAINEDRAVICGGRRVTNWEKTRLNGLYMYRAKLSDVDSVREFSVDGKRKELASIFKKKSERKGWGIIPHTGYSKIEIRFAELPGIVNPSQMECVWIAEWKMFQFRAENIEGNVITMKEPYYSRITSIVKLAGSITEHDPNGYWWPTPSRHPMYLQNDISFITERGMFCFDEREKYLYYYPEFGEDIEKSVCVIGELDEIIKIRGRDDVIPERVKNITFRGLRIENGDFSMIAKEGLGINQAQSYYAGIATLSDKNTIDIPYSQYTANINVDYAENVEFINCTVRNTSRGGIYFHDGVFGGLIEGCVFENIGDSAIIIGDGMHGFWDDMHITRDITVVNNLIRRTSVTVFSAPGIQAYFVKNLLVAHNDIYDVGYCGMAIGWGWTVCLDSHITENIVIEHNRVGNFGNKVRDCGGIYTLGQAPDSLCRSNYIFEQMNAFGAIYHDEGSAGYETYNNVVNSDLCHEDVERSWLCLNAFPNGPGGIQSVYNLSVHDNWYNNRREDCLRADKASVKVYDNTYVEEENFPFEAMKVINESGVEDKYKYIFGKLIS
ncbi:MAG: right-handed parallel beta-helix repeat-containing protein [Christensenellales bacterium]